MYGDMDSFLMHYGVPGQKKGRRRYQNEDGTLTEEGKEHYGVGDGDQKRKYYTQASKEELERRLEEVKKIDKRMTKQTAVQGAIGISAIVAGHVMRKYGHSAGRLIQSFGKGFLIGTAVGQTIQTGASFLSKNLLNKELEKRKEA